MKQKRILIVYLNGFLSNIALKEHTFNEVVKEMEAEGRTVKTTFSRNGDKTTIFEDGTKVQCLPFGRSMAGMRLTHLYVDGNILKLNKGEKALIEVFSPMLLPEGEYANFEVKGKAKDRIIVF